MTYVAFPGACSSSINISTTDQGTTVLTVYCRPGSKAQSYLKLLLLLYPSYPIIMSQMWSIPPTFSFLYSQTFVNSCLDYWNKISNLLPWCSLYLHTLNKIRLSKALLWPCPPFFIRVIKPTVHGQNSFQVPNNLTIHTFLTQSPTV